MPVRIEPVEKPLKLQNDGELEIVFIGVGGAFSYTLFNTNFLIIKGDAHLLVDFGNTGPYSLPQATGLGLGDISAILPTHSHCDHIGGVESLALWNRYVAIPFHNKPKLKMIISEDYERILWNNSLRGGMELNEINSEGKALSFGDYFDVVRPRLKTLEPRPIFEVDWNGLHLELFGTNHIPEQAMNARDAFITHGLMIDGRVFFSGDTKFDRPLLDMYADRSEIMFHDTSFMPNPVHASLQELRTLPEEMKKKIMLVHYGDAWQNQDTSEFLGLTRQGMRYIFD
jgi:ribonuclease BN (tRNA processing enzyme)